VALVRQFRQGAAQLGLRVADSETPIQPLLVGDSANALRLSARVREQGILVTAIRPPTVAEGSARLRVTFSATHTTQQVDRLLGALELVCATDE
jgi:8-amino-7-oxononanoate synthase